MSEVVQEEGSVQELTEHEQAMVDLVDSKEATAKGNANPDEATEYVEETTEEVKLPEKFKSTEDLIKAYNELEKKLGTKEEVTEDTPSESQSEPEASEVTEDQGQEETKDVSTDNSAVEDLVSIETGTSEVPT